MSPNVGNFVHDLVEMAKAMETLPMVQAELDKAHSDIEAYANQVQRLELRLIDRANELETLNAKLREAEVAKDMAETMFLNETDRTDKALAFVRTLFGNAGSLIQALEPPTPVPPVVPVDVPALIAQPEPIPSRTIQEVDHTSDYTPKATEAPTSLANPPQSDTNPGTMTNTVFVDSSSDTVAPTPSTVSSADKPYTGKNWSEVEPRVWSQDDWLANGGTPDSWIA